jgi:hypothetical protein
MANAYSYRCQKLHKQLAKPLHEAMCAAMLTSALPVENTTTAIHLINHVITIGTSVGQTGRIKMNGDIVLDRVLFGAYVGMGIVANQSDDYMYEWSEGQIELVEAACRYVDYAIRLAEAAYAVAGDFPGVLEYEVAEPFGTWFCESMVKRKGLVPTSMMCRVYLLNDIQVFCADADSEPELHEEIGEALMRVPFPFC